MLYIAPSLPELPGKLPDWMAEASAGATALRITAGRDVVFVDELPHTATGKISKVKLREEFRAYKLLAARRRPESEARGARLWACARPVKD